MARPQSITDRLALSITETAQATGLGRTSIYQLIATGALKTRKVGRRRIVLRADLETFLQGLKAGDGDV